ncbi:hypothetical protein GUITHDRAFT_71349 [Guillardia theta CCMP2712]|uniref:Large subunit ribosomal protein L13 n=1 Tax=Guillardia theta (strain CCMP2712) TaxID=905079 RepID=L1JA35_GUITC|nr:hypothetical protein GUITHDRAFT_71349 [Guillardia theta CCMP2712]EKX45376.1 hypothetical protein GUITHDRAFT_71349 [Guillardia theta CCMP2712]|eukprot:XP_005832356.1 hypothetical protein GUITHDRAFT_71349 [Guillardia theta CCMP2712]
MSTQAVLQYLHGADVTVSRENTFRRWWIMDARDYTLGKLASLACRLIMGKHKPIFDRSLVLGDFVIVTNAPEINVARKSQDTKLYRYHTAGYPGGLVETPYMKMLKEKPEEVIRRAISGMLPKNNLRKERMKLLRVFRTSEHPHLAEEPTIVRADLFEVLDQLPSCSLPCLDCILSLSRQIFS